MENELHCRVCSNIIEKAVLLPCSHNVCYGCLENILAVGLIDGNIDSASDDSGYLSTNGDQLNAKHNSSSYVVCPRCSRCCILDDRGIEGLPKNLIVDNLVQRHKAKHCEIDCQLCELNPPKKAEIICEQCQVAYCKSCLTVCHPMRGPLAKHCLIQPNSDRVIDVSSKLRGVLKCDEHEDENISMYCIGCKLPVCYLCFERGRHEGHDTKALGTMFKDQKGDLIRNVKVLTEKNKLLQDFLSEIQDHIDKLKENAVEFESRLVAQCDNVSNMMEKRKELLLKDVTSDLNGRHELLRHQFNDGRELMKETAGLLHYTIEVLQEKDPAVFLQISNTLNSRLVNTSNAWLGNNGFRPVVTADIDLKLDLTPIADAIDSLSFTQLKVESIPGQPEIITEECSVTNNTLVLCWQMLENNAPTEYGYSIEIDDGLGGEFTVVLRTDQFTCTLDGLQFQSTYRARVKAYNKSGCGEASDVVYLTTPDVAVFALDPSTAHNEICLSNENYTMTCSSYESRVVLGDIGFSRGKHYWEVTIDRFEGNPDPAVGIATLEASRDKILGKDSQAWSVYVDSNRSWFQHNNEHLFRTEGGIGVSSTLGLLLDLDDCTLTFYCNDHQRGPIHFQNLANVETVYPAFSLNHNVTMTLHTGLDLPDDL